MAGRYPGLPGVPTAHLRLHGVPTAHLRLPGVPTAHLRLPCLHPLPNSDRGLVLQSAQSILKTTEQAMAHTRSLRKVVIMEMLPRDDHPHLSPLSCLFNTTLRELVASSPLHLQIHVASHHTLTPTSEGKKVAIFGPRSSPSSDGIHLKGVQGVQRHTSSVIGILQAAGVAPPSSQLAASSPTATWATQGRRGAARPQPARTYSEAVQVSNQWWALNY